MSKDEYVAEPSQQLFSEWSEWAKQLRPSLSRLLANEADVEDVLSQTLVNVAQSMARREWKVKIRSFSAYFTVTALRLGFKRLRERKREVTLDGDDEQTERTIKAVEEKYMRDNDPTSDYNYNLGKEEFFKNLPRAVTSNLSEEEKDIGYMCFNLNLSTEEMAAELGKSLEYTRYQVNKLKAKLRYRLLKIYKQNI